MIIQRQSDWQVGIPYLLKLELIKTHEPATHGSASSPDAHPLLGSCCQDLLKISWFPNSLRPPRQGATTFGDLRGAARLPPPPLGTGPEPSPARLACCLRCVRGATTKPED